MLYVRTYRIVLLYVLLAIPCICLGRKSTSSCTLPISQTCIQFSDCTIMHILSGTGNACGHSVVENAVAIANAHTTHGISPKTVFACSCAYNKRFTGKGSTNNEQVAALARTIPGFSDEMAIFDHTPNGYIFLSASKHTNVQHPHIGKKALKEILCNVKYGAAHRAHFVYNTGNHWVLVSIVKTPGQKPCMVYMDSCNKPVTPEHSILGFMKYIHACYKAA